MDNVIQFPKNRNDITAKPLDMEDVENKILNLRLHHINETLAEVVPNLFASLESAGFIFEAEEDDTEDKDLRDGAFLVESIRSILCKRYGIPHPFQEIADEVFHMSKDGEDVKFIIAKELNIKFRNSSEEL
jgi:hypothetical protein